MKLLRLSLMLVLALALAACGDAAQTRSASDLTVRLELEPSAPATGQQATLRLAAERAGRPLEDARFTVTQRMAAMDHAGAPLAGTPLAGGTSELQTSFAMPGRWELEVAVSAADRQPEIVVFTLDVE